MMDEIDTAVLLTPETMANKLEWARLTAQQREARMIATRGACKDCGIRAIDMGDYCGSCYPKHREKRINAEQRT